MGEVGEELERRPAAYAEPIHVPSERLSEMELVRRELAALREHIAQPPAPEVSRRVRILGPARVIREDAAQPTRTYADGDRRRGVADLLLALEGFGALAVGVVGSAALIVVLVVMFGLYRLAARFAVWAGSGGALLGAAALVLGSVAIVAAGLWVVYRLTGGRRVER
jgi:hypothetical protein